MNPFYATSFSARLHASLALVLAVLFTSAARAASPPDMPLPACTQGIAQGSCPSNSQSDQVAAAYNTRFTAGQPTVISTVPALPKCSHYLWGDNIWTPSTCYASINQPSIGTCLVIDLQDEGRLKRMLCPQALYKASGASTGSQLFERWLPGSSDNNHLTCGLSSSFGDGRNSTGGRDSNGREYWAEAGAERLTCDVTLRHRPDGLYGPTWVEVEVGLTVMRTGCCNGYPTLGYGDHIRASIFVPVDGDLREQGPDVAVTARSTLDESRRAQGELFATYRVTLANQGDETAGNVRLLVAMPDQVRLLAPYPSSCQLADTALLLPGASFSCTGLSLTPGSSDTLEFSTRITNAADVEAVRFEAIFPADANSSNNVAEARIEPTFERLAFADTADEMRVLLAYNNDLYVGAPTALINTGAGLACNTYAANIWDRLETIRRAHPEAFDRLAYGRVTSQPAGYQDGDSTSGHYGVVVYLKGTNYHETGIIIHGTAGPSRYPAQSDTIVGSGDLSSPLDYTGTTINGKFIRTPVSRFQGQPRQENDGIGFEGDYPAASQGAAGGPSCAFAPDAVAVSTESPVEIHIRNARGQRVRTAGGVIAVQELGVGIHGYSFPHEDGSHAWNLILPRDDYEIDLVGTAEGPYRLTLTTYTNGQPVERVTQGWARPGVIEVFAIRDRPATSGPGPQPPDPPAPDRSGGGGGLSPAWLLALFTLSALYRPRRDARGGGRR